MFKSTYQNFKTIMASMAIILCLSSFTTSGESKMEPAVQSRENVAEKTAIITGSNRGQGLGWVKYYLKEGYLVVATARKPEKATDLIELKKQYKDQLLIEKLDVTSEDDMAALGATLKDKNIKIDIAISNAGVTVEEDFGNWTVKGLESNLRVNTVGAALFAQTISPYLNDGAILLQLSSGHGSIANQKKITPIDAYGISKAGLNMLTKKLSIRWADRQIIVVSITPGGVKTDMNPYGKLSVKEAIDIMAETLSNLTIEDSGTFINNKGKPMDW